MVRADRVDVDLLDVVSLEEVVHDDLADLHALRPRLNELDASGLTELSALPLLPAGGSAPKAATDDKAIAPASAAKAVLRVWVLMKLSTSNCATSQCGCREGVIVQPDTGMFVENRRRVTRAKKYHGL